MVPHVKKQRVVNTILQDQSWKKIELAPAARAERVCISTWRKCVKRLLSPLPLIANIIANT